MDERMRPRLLALYAAVVAAIGLVDRRAPLYRALCQLRAEIERACDLPQTPTRRQLT